METKTENGIWILCMVFVPWLFEIDNFVMVMYGTEGYFLAQTLSKFGKINMVSAHFERNTCYFNNHDNSQQYRWHSSFLPMNFPYLNFEILKTLIYIDIISHLHERTHKKH